MTAFLGFANPAEIILARGSATPWEDLAPARYPIWLGLPIAPGTIIELRLKVLNPAGAQVLEKQQLVAVPHARELDHIQSS
jgi:hypothetical protein